MSHVAALVAIVAVEIPDRDAKAKPIADLNIFCDAPDRLIGRYAFRQRAKPASFPST